MPSLEPPVCAPAVPDGGKNGGVNPGRDQLGQVDDPPGDTSAVVAGQARDTSVSPPPSLKLVPDSFNHIRNANILDSSSGISLKFLFNLTQILAGPSGPTRCDCGKNGLGGDTFAAQPLGVFHQHFTEVVPIPPGP